MHFHISEGKLKKILWEDNIPNILVTVMVMKAGVKCIYQATWTQRTMLYLENWQCIWTAKCIQMGHGVVLFPEVFFACSCAKAGFTILKECMSQIHKWLLSKYVLLICTLKEHKQLNALGKVMYIKMLKEHIAITLEGRQHWIFATIYITVIKIDISDYDYSKITFAWCLTIYLPYHLS